MFPNVKKEGSIPHAVEQVEKPARRRRPADRSRLGANVDTVAEHDRRSLCVDNPNSRLNVPGNTAGHSSNPQGRAATMCESSSPLVPSSSPVFVGIDVAKDTLEVFIDSSLMNLPPQRLSLDNNEKAINTLIEKLKKANVRLVILESTGRYHRCVAGMLLAADIPTKVLNPQRARDFAKAQGKLEKSDPIDAQVLADYARAICPKPDVAPKAGEAELADLIARRRALVQMRIAETNRSHERMPKLAATQSKKMLELIQRQIDDLDSEIASKVQADDDWHNKSKIIDSVPGIGPDSANQLVIDLPELGNLNRQQIAKLVGVAPLMRDSGHARGQRTIGGGRRDVRTTLYMLAHNAVLHCPRFKEFFKELRSRGKAHKVAMTACMRKLLITLNQMVKTNTTWKPNLQPATA
jgi:transposase